MQAEGIKTRGTRADFCLGCGRGETMHASRINSIVQASVHVPSTGPQPASCIRSCYGKETSPSLRLRGRARRFRSTTVKRARRFRELRRISTVILKSENSVTEFSSHITLTQWWSQSCVRIAGPSARAGLRPIPVYENCKYNESVC